MVCCWTFFSDVDASRASENDPWTQKRARSRAQTTQDPIPARISSRVASCSLAARLGACIRSKRTFHLRCGLMDLTLVSGKTLRAYQETARSALIPGLLNRMAKTAWGLPTDSMGASASTGPANRTGELRFASAAATRMPWEARSTSRYKLPLLGFSPLSLALASSACRWRRRSRPIRARGSSLQRRRPARRPLCLDLVRADVARRALEPKH